MNNKKIIGIGLCCLFASFFIPVLLNILLSSNLIKDFETLFLFNSIFFAIAAIGTGYLSLKNSFFTSEIGRIAGIILTINFLIVSYNQFKIYSDIFHRGIFESITWLVILTLFSVIAGIFYLKGIKCNRSIKIFGSLMFVVDLISGILSILQQNAFEAMGKTNDFESFEIYRERLHNLGNMMYIVSLITACLALVSFILTIVWMYKKSESEEFEYTEYPKDYTENIEEETIIQEVVTSKPKNGFSYNAQPTKAGLGLALCSLFSYYLLFAYLIYTTIIEPISNTLNGNWRSLSESEPSMLPVMLMFGAGVCLFIASMYKNTFKNAVGNFFGVLTAILMGFCAYLFSPTVTKTKIDIPIEIFILSLLVLGVFSIITLALIKTENGKGFKGFGFVGIGLYLAIIILCLNVYAKMYGSYSDAKDLFEILKICSIGFVFCMFIGLILSIVNLTQPMKYTPDEYKL